jgi:hypothetical protein
MKLRQKRSCSIFFTLTGYFYLSVHKETYGLTDNYQDSNGCTENLREAIAVQ